MADHKCCVWAIPGMEHWGRAASTALGWPLYVGTPVPPETTLVHVIGMYDPPTYAFTSSCVGFVDGKVIHWCGTDVLALPEGTQIDALHLCQSPLLKDELAQKGIEAEVVMFPAPQQLEVPADWPREKRVGIYLGSSPESYGVATAEQVAEILQPEGYEFAAYTFGSFTDVELRELIYSCRAYLRLTWHDGCAMSAREYMAAGRRAVITADLPYAKRIPLDDVQRIVRELRGALDAEGPDLEAAAYWQRENSVELFIERLRAAGAL